MRATASTRSMQPPLHRALGLLLAGLAFAVPVPALDLDLYAEILQEHTRETGDLAGVRVDYRALRGDPRWPRLLASLEATQPERLAGKDEQLAFWANAYNVLAIDLVVKQAPEESIRDIGSFLRPVWKRPAGRIGDRSYSLDAIEHGIVRPLGDPRAHVAVICASLSCPPLRREPWRAEALDAQLDEQLRLWLAHPDKGLRLDREKRVLHLSRIFDWFEEDFEDAGGVNTFVARYAPTDVAAWLQANPDVRVRHLDYDWRLNALP